MTMLAFLVLSLSLFCLSVPPSLELAYSIALILSYTDNAIVLRACMPIYIYMKFYVFVLCL